MISLRLKKGRTLFGVACFMVAAFCLQTPNALADAAAGKKIFTAKKCEACHQMAGPTEPKPVSARPKIKGPPLWFAGSKFKKEWLTAWLAKPTPIRRVKYGTLVKGSNDHPLLPAADAADVGAYLMSLTDSAVKTGAIDSSPLSPRAVFQADQLFAKKQVCFGCHQYPSKRGNIGGFTGPSLVGAGTRLQADWIYAMLKDNIRYYPDGRMPKYGDEAFNQFSDDDLKLLAQYIGNF